VACYEYERAVREGYLVDYDAVTIKSDVRLKGIFLSEGEQVRLVRKNPIPDNICCFLNDFADCAILSACPLLMSFGNYWELSLVSSWIY